MIFHQSIIWLSVLALFFIGLSIVIGKIWPAALFYNRKFLHVSVISLLAYQVKLMDAKWNVPFSLILLVVEILLIVAVFKGFFEIEGRKSWGIIYFLPPIIFLLLCFSDYNQQIALSIAILAFSDGLSAIFGRMFQSFLSTKQTRFSFAEQIARRNTIQWGQDQKTVFGSMIFTLATMLILHWNDESSSGIKLVYMALALASVELLSGKGSDNFFIPLASFFVLLFFQTRETELIEFLNQYSWVLVLFIPLVLLILRLKWLNYSGVFIAVYLAAFVLLSGLSLWPMVAFFVMGSLAGKLNKRVLTDEKHNKPRDAFQVLANGGVVLILIFFSSFNSFNIDLNLLMLISISVASADTLSSEIGMKFGKKTFNIITFRPIEKGLSGGVSFPGFVGAILGAFAIACFDFEYFYYILFWGILGSVVDSLLGLILQAKYSNNGVLTDQKVGDLVKGYAFITNDAVNFWSNLLVVFLAYLFLG